MLCTVEYKSSPSSTTCGPTGTGSRKSKLTTSYTSVYCRPGVITHSPPHSTVVDLQTTTCVGAAGVTIPHQSQVTRPWSCGQYYVCCVHVMPVPCSYVHNSSIAIWIQTKHYLLRMWWNGCSTIAFNSHILRMVAVMITKIVSLAVDQPWFKTRTPDIIQPDSSSPSPITAQEKK